MQSHFKIYVNIYWVLVLCMCSLYQAGKRGSPLNFWHLFDNTEVGGLVLYKVDRIQDKMESCAWSQYDRGEHWKRKS